MGVEDLPSEGQTSSAEVTSVEEERRTVLEQQVKQEVCPLSCVRRDQEGCVHWQSVTFNNTYLCSWAVFVKRVLTVEKNTFRYYGQFTIHNNDDATC